MNYTEQLEARIEEMQQQLSVAQTTVAHMTPSWQEVKKHGVYRYGTKFYSSMFIIVVTIKSNTGEITYSYRLEASDKSLIGPYRLNGMEFPTLEEAKKAVEMMVHERIQDE